MKDSIKAGLVVIVAIGGVNLAVFGHEVGETHYHTNAPPAVPLKFDVEKTGPIAAPPALSSKAELKVSGQGFWQFAAATEGVLPIPEEIRSYLKGAHGTLIVDAPRDTVYWGLAKVGWVAFSNKLSQSWVVKGDPMFAGGNLHGADLLYRQGKLPLVAVADNEQGAVYLSDTTFQHTSKWDWPQKGPYKSKGQYHPTDVAFTSQDTLFVTDGYGQAYFMAASINPLNFQGDFYGGKSMSQTPHGVTLNPADGTLLISARPEGQVKRWSITQSELIETHGLPPGSTVCDIDIWGDYALAPCLDGPKQTPGPIYIINLKKHTIVSTLKAKKDLGFSEAQHIHDATWYLASEGEKKELYILFTNWNPGGIGAMKLVNVLD